MAEGVFLCWGKFGGGAAIGIQKEEWIVAKAAGAGGSAQDSAGNPIAGGENDPAIGIGEGQGADETGGAFGIFNFMQLLQQKLIIMNVPFRAAVHLGPAGAVDAGLAVEGVDGEAAVVG